MPSRDRELRRALVDSLRAAGHICSAEVAEAMLAIPRHVFVEGYASLKEAYHDYAIALSIQDGSPVATISAPHAVARMLEWLMPLHGLRVLEVGTASGYNAALLAYLTGEQGLVVTVELDQVLVEQARKAAGYAGVADNVVFVHGDGCRGYPPAAPYDRITVTAGSPQVAMAWFEQLGQSGRLLLPIELVRGTRSTYFPVVLEKNEERLEGAFKVFPMSFVPLRSALVPSAEALSEHELIPVSALLPIVRCLGLGEQEAFYLQFFQLVTRIRVSAEGLLQKWLQAGRPTPGDFRLVVTPERDHGLDWVWDDSTGLITGVKQK